VTDTDIEVGPVDYVIIEFPGTKLTGESLPILQDLVDRGVIRILDLSFIMKDTDGTVTGIDVTDVDGDGVNDLVVWQRYESGLLDEDDIADAANALEPGNAAAIIVYENSWAAPFVGAMRRAGAELVASGRIPATDLLAVLDELEAEDTSAE
jgi:hypothetical protein